MSAVRKALTRQLIRHQQLIGQQVAPRAALPKQIYPALIEQAFTTALGATMVTLVRQAIAPVLAALPSLLSRARTEHHLDAGESRAARALVVAARDRLTAGVQAVAPGIAASYAAQVSTYQRVQLDRQTEAGLGIRLGALGSDATQHIADAFADSIVVELDGLVDKMMADVQATIIRALRDGQLYADIAGALEARFSFGERRALLIAADQIRTLYGHINVHRQKQLGVDKFVWFANGGARDAHAARHGKIYRYANPPGGELPGGPVLCECQAMPVLDFSDDGAI